MADPESLIPKASGAIDADRLRAMPLAPRDGFILSRVDGMSSVGDLAQTMGMDVEDVIASLIKLESLGLVELPKAPRPPPARSPQPMRVAPPPRSPSPDPRQSPRPPPSAPRVQASPPRAQPSSPPSAVVAVTPNLDILPEQQQQIASTFAQLDQLDHYAVLGVARGVDKKAIKRAYFELTAKYHPDRFFRKQIGHFKPQLEAIFGRMTEAHDTLTDAAKRVDYDAYIGSVERTRGIEQMVAEAAAELRRAEEVMAGVAISSIPPPLSSSAHPSSPPSSSPVPSPPKSGPTLSFPNEPPTRNKASPFPNEPTTRNKASPFPSESPTQVSGRPSPPNLNRLIGDALTKPPGTNRIAVPSFNSEPPDAQTRREMLAKRLTGQRGPSAQFTRGPAATKVPAIAYAKTDDAVDALKRRYEEKVAAARTAQTRKYSEAGMMALEKGDVVAAANSLRVALSFDAENAELKIAYDKAQRAADQLLGDQYLKQADYEEKAEKWAEAARSWRRVARARENDAKAHERAAHCLVKSAGNLHDAGALAQRAVMLSPKDAGMRLTLANVYLAAGLTLNARRELETAAQLAPSDANIVSLLKRIAKSD